MQIEICGLTDVGQGRKHKPNEDNFVVCGDIDLNIWEKPVGQTKKVSTKGSILFVADGMGGTNAGEVASEIARRAVEERFKELDIHSGSSVKDILTSSILFAHNKIVEKQNEDPNTQGMGTTAIITWVKDDKAHIAWSGDG